MNFQDLLARIKKIDEADGDPDMMSQENPEAAPEMGMEECGDEPMGASSPKDQLLIGEKGMEECGMPGMGGMPSGMMGMGSPKQPDSVSMNLSMNANGAGGIRDLMDILRNLENGDHSHEMPHDMPGEADAIVVGMGEEQGAGFGQATTEPNTHTYDVDTMTGMGNDIHSKGEEFAKVNGGGNAMTVSETLVNRLSSLYQEVKLR